MILAQLPDPSDFLMICQFQNQRDVYYYEGFKLEVDKSSYEFGIAYEIEIESTEPERAKSVVEKLLTDNGIGFGFSKRSKYGNLKAGSIL